MPDKFDPYREALVMEESTVWSDQFDDIEPDEREKIASLLHAEPEQCATLEYVRTHTGFCRQITVTEQDLERIGVSS